MARQRSAGFQSAVSPTSSRQAVDDLASGEGACGLEIRDTADWKSALRLPVGETREISGLGLAFSIDFTQAAPETAGTMPSKLFIGIASLSVAGLLHRPGRRHRGRAPASGQGVQITNWPIASGSRSTANSSPSITSARSRDRARVPGHGPRRVGHDAGLADEKQPERGA